MQPSRKNSDSTASAACPAAPKRIQSISVSFDSLVTIKEIVLKNNAGPDAPIYVALINNNNEVHGVTSVPEGTGFEKNIYVTLASPITIQNELKIHVYKDTTVSTAVTAPVPVSTTALPSQILSSGKPVCFSVKKKCAATLDVFNLQGAKIGSLFSGEVTGGPQSFIWNGKTVCGRQVSNSAVILRLTTPEHSAVKPVQVLH